LYFSDTEQGEPCEWKLSNTARVDLV
jgi:hypothetical protein